MKSAKYAVVRYVADSARNEPINIGIVAWNDSTSSLRIDDDSLAKVVRDNPHLTSDSLLYVRGFLESQFAASGAGGTVEAVENCIRRQRIHPIALTEPRLTTVTDGSEGALEVALDRLMKRVVKPKTRSGGRKTSAESALAKRWKPWLGRQIHRDYVFQSSRSGNARSVDFFANSTLNLAVDIVRLNILRSDEIVQRADAQAFKVQDILAGSDSDLSFQVYCEFRPELEYEFATTNAIRSLESAGASISSDLDEVAKSVEHKLKLF